MADYPEGATGTDRKTNRPVVRSGGKWVYADDKLTEDQGKSQGYAKMMSNAEQRYNEALKQGYNPTTLRNTTAAILEGLPFGGLDGLGAAVRDDVGDLGRQAELQWSDAQLKAVSGASSPEAEVKRGVKTFFPRPGENPFQIGPEKREARAMAFDAVRRRAGPAAREIAAPNGGGRNQTPKTKRPPLSSFQR